MCPGLKRLHGSHGPLSSLSVAHVPLSVSGCTADRVTWATDLAVSGPCAPDSSGSTGHMGRCPRCQRPMCRCQRTDCGPCAPDCVSDVTAHSPWAAVRERLHR
nr:hypothetical protein Itr_chr09CG16480 [Ipomoea trifida]